MNTHLDDIEIIDSHAHFMTRDFFKERLLGQGDGTSLERLQQRFQRLNRPAWDFPPEGETHQDLANKWLAEMKEHNIAKMVFFSMDKDIADFGRAMNSSDQLIGYLYANPHREGIQEEIKVAVKKHGVKGLKLNPTLHYYHTYDKETAYPIFELAQKYKLPCVIHFGLSIGADADARYMNPIDISAPAKDFPEVNFILAHFGTGFFREALFTLYHAENIYLDTSSSNAWIKYLPYDIDLTGVFRKALDVGTAEKIIFGTDSSFFPRGFRQALLQEQFRILTSLNVSYEELQLIFAGNIKRLLGID